jgi:hypothetical protein
VDQVVTKDATVTTVESQNPNGEFHVLLSTDDLDRDNERLFANEWKQPLPERITFDSDHGMSVATTVGSGVPVLTDKGIEVRGTYASTQHAQNVRALVSEGHITKTSVSFSVHKTQKDGKVERELLNGAFVAVPANDKAVVLSSKSAQVFKWMADQKAADGTSDAQGSPQGGQGSVTPTMRELVQAVHDAAIHLGAMMDGEITDFDTGASDGANKAIETSDVNVGSPQISAEESAATAAAATKAAAADAADESADHAAAVRLKAQAFLIQKSLERLANAE